LGLNQDSSIAAWETVAVDSLGTRTIVNPACPAPNNGFIAIAAGWRHNLASTRVPASVNGHILRHEQ
jgi:hypothetical protein